MIALSPTATDRLERHFRFERCFGFRDLGGYAGLDGRTVRWRTLFRSMTPEYMTEADVAAARALALATVIDLRGPRFQTSGPLGEPPAVRVAVGRSRPYRRLPKDIKRLIEAAPEEALPLYLERMGRNFVRAAAIIVRARGGVLFHCRLGKDRSGLFSAVLLKLLGVSDADVIEDYMATTPFIADALQLVWDAEKANPIDRVQAESRLSREPPKREAMEAVLRRLEEYGGAYAYLLEHGAAPRTLNRLIQRLLEGRSMAAK